MSESNPIAEWMEFISGGNYAFVGKVLQNRELTKQQLSFHISDHNPLWAEFGLSI